ncbi:hypothetical protein QZH41_007774 [Actinostola sp. cb2023]|nr:hypothetical protein QZH41_007774 [Actinostola sp. cb2023]
MATSTQRPPTQRPPLHNGHLYTTATSTQRPPLHNGHLYTTATSTQRPPLHNSHLYTTATSTQRPPLHNGHLYTTATSTQRPPLHNGHLYTTATSTQRPPLHNGHLYTTATSTQRPPLHNGHLYTTATSTQRPPLHNGQNVVLAIHNVTQESLKVLAQGDINTSSDLRDISLGDLKQNYTKESQHIQYASHFPIPYDCASQHDINQRLVLLYGVGKARTEAIHKNKDTTNSLKKMLHDLASPQHGGSYEYSQGLKSSVLKTRRAFEEQISNLYSKFSSLPCFEQYMAIAEMYQCAARPSQPKPNNV